MPKKNNIILYNQLRCQGWIKNWGFFLNFLRTSPNSWRMSYHFPANNISKKQFFMIEFLYILVNRHKCLDKFAYVLPATLPKNYWFLYYFCFRVIYFLFNTHNLFVNNNNNNNKEQDKKEKEKKNVNLFFEWSCVLAKKLVLINVY